MAALNVRPPDVFPRASQTIPKIIDLVRLLEAQGHAYSEMATSISAWAVSPTTAASAG